MEETAYHEAGHAVLAKFLGGRVRSLTIEPDRDDRPARFGDTEILWPRMAKPSRELLNKQIMVALAGPVVEAIYTEEPRHPAFVAEWKEDWNLAWELSATLHPDEQRRLQFLEEVTRYVGEVMRRDSIWAAVAALADELLAHETLEAEQIEEVLSVWL